MTRSNTPGVDKKTAWCDERRFREVWTQIGEIERTLREIECKEA